MKRPWKKSYNNLTPTERQKSLAKRGEYVIMKGVILYAGFPRAAGDAARETRRIPMEYTIMMLALIGVMYFFMIRPENKRKKQAQERAIVPIVQIILVLLAVAFFWPVFIVLLPILAGPILAGFYIYAIVYFRGEKFLAIKSSIGDYIQDCNALNAHIEELRASYISIKKTDYGEVTYSNVGTSNYKRKGFADAKYAPNIYDCSRVVCDNARKQPFKYICKYFNVKENEPSLVQFEGILNNFSAAEEGKELSRRKRQEILDSIASEIPWVIRKFFSKRLDKELGFDEFQFDELFFPVFSFRYISPGGKSGTQFDITMDIDMMERFINYLSERVKFKKSALGQRRLMTPKLRRFIIERDNSTCQQCGNSTDKEPNLLLEVDHIIPVAKGGMTTEENLQTLCWKCNRRKGSKVS